MTCFPTEIGLSHMGLKFESMNGLNVTMQSLGRGLVLVAKGVGWPRPQPPRSQAIAVPRRRPSPPGPMALLAFLKQPHLKRLLQPGFPEISGAGKWIGQDSFQSSVRFLHSSEHAWIYGHKHFQRSMFYLGRSRKRGPDKIDVGVLVSVKRFEFYKVFTFQRLILGTKAGGSDGVRVLPFSSFIGNSLRDVLPHMADSVPAGETVACFRPGPWG